MVKLPCGHDQENLKFDWRLATNADNLMLLEVAQLTCDACLMRYAFTVTDKETRVATTAVSDDGTSVLFVIQPAEPLAIGEVH